MPVPHAGTAFIDIYGNFEPLGKQLKVRGGLLQSESTGIGKKIALGIGAGAAAAGVGLFKIGEQFDSASDKIRVQTGKTGKHLAGLQKDFKAVVKDVPADFDTASSAIAGLNQRLGLTGKPLRKLTEQITELSRLTGTDVNENVASTTRLFGDWSIATGKQGKTLDKLFRVSQHTGITISDLSRKMVAFGSPLRQLGINFDFAASMFGEFEKNGVNTQTLMPGLRFAIKSFSGAIPKTTAELKKLGISMDDPQKALQQVMKLIKDAPNDLKANSIAFKVFGVRAGPDMAAAIREGHFQLKGLMSTMEHGHDTILKASKDTQDLSEKWQLFKNKAMVGLAPIATRVFNTVGKRAQGLFKVLNDPHLTTDEKIQAVFAQVRKLFQQIAPKLADEAARMAPHVAEAFVQAFLSAGPWGRLVLTAVLLKKMGGLGAFRKLGVSAGTQVGAGMATGVAGSGLKGRLIGTFKGMAPGLAAALLVAFGPEFAKKAKEGLSGQTTDFKLPQHATEPLGSLIGPVGNLEKAAERLDGDKLLAFGDKAETMFKKLSKAKDSRGLVDMAQQARDLAKQFPSSAKELNHFADVAEKAAKQAGGSFKDLRPITGDIRDAIHRMATGGTQSIRSLKTNVALNTRLIKNTLGKDSEAGKEALSKNFAAAIKNVKRSMADGTVTTKKGTAEIERLMVAALQNMGFSKTAAISLRRSQAAHSTNTPGANGQARPHATGGMVVPGSGTGDKVHLQAMVEPGEEVFVLNRNAARKKRALQTLNAMVPRFQTGGSVTGDTDFLPALFAALKAMSAAAGVPIFVQSGRRTVAEQLAQGPSTPGHPVAGPNGPHVRGVAADITPGFGTFGRLAARFGLGFTVMPQEPWHIQLLKAMGGALAGSAPMLKRVLASGPDSPLKGLVQGALDTTRSAAQQVVQDAFAASFANGPESGVGGATSAGGQYGKAALRRLWVRAGGSPSMANLMAAIALAESGGDPGIVNSIGATGLWQIHPGGAQYKDPLTNAKTAVAKLGSQGLGAWEAYTNGSYRNFLQRGGLVGLQKGGMAKAAGLFTGKQNPNGWAGRGRALMEKVWPIARQYLPGAGKAMPKTSFTTGLDSLFVGADQNGHVYWPKWLTKGRHGLLAKDNAILETLIHEWTHVFQNHKATDSTWRAEGGAESFAHEFAPRIFKAAGIPYHNPAVMELYAKYFKRVHGELGEKWIRHGQFTAPPGNTAHGTGRVHKLLGGLVGLQGGGRVGKAIRNARYVARHVSVPRLRKSAAKNALAAIKGLGLPASLNAKLKKQSTNAAIFDDHAQRADAVSTTDANGNTIPGTVLGKTQADWLGQELTALFAWRNAILRAESIIANRRKQVAKLLEQARKRLTAVKTALKSGQRRHTTLAGQLKGFQGRLQRAQKHPKKNHHLIGQLQKRIASTRLGLGEVDIRQASRRRELGALGTLIGDGTHGLTGRDASLKDRAGTLESSLQDVQGLGSTHAVLKTLPSIGTLGGRLLDVQVSLRDLLAPVTATDGSSGVGSTDSSDAASQLNDLLAQQNTTLAQRLAVSQAQYGVFKDFPPFGGSFKTGGTIPGPVGAPRTIIAHGGEEVLSVDDLRDPAGGTVIHQHHVYLDGQKLDAKIDTRVVKVTRTIAQKGARPAAGVRR